MDTLSLHKTPHCGFMLATVLSNNNDKLKGTLKLQLLSENSGESILEDVKILSPFTGENYGFYALPEIGEQVIVGFFDGCIDRPFVLGALASSSDPYISDVFNKENSVKSLKTKGNNVISLSDKKDEQAITVKTPKKLSLVLDEKTESISITADKNKITVDAKNGKILLEADKEISVKSGNAQITLKSNGDISLDANSLKFNGKTAELKANSIKIESSGALSMSAQKNELKGSVIDVNSQGMLNLKGSLTKIN